MMLPFRSRSENTGHNRYPGALTRRLRSVLCWYFAFDSSVSLQSVAQDILRTVHRQNAAHPLSYLPGAALYSLAAIVSAMAWWTVWKRKASARRWALAISVWNVLVGAPLFYYWLYGWSGYRQLFLGSLWLPTLAGVVGLGAFLRPYQETGEKWGWRWSFRLGGGLHCFVSCMGAIGLTEFLSEGLWSQWLRTPHNPLPQLALTSLALFLGLLTVCAAEARQIWIRLLATGHSVRWTAPLILAIVGLAACPPALERLRLLFVLLFIVAQAPIFLDSRPPFPRH
jgi:hypothetical protein